MQTFKKSVDEVLYEFLGLLYQFGEVVNPRGSTTKELLNVNFILTDPRARLFLSEHRVLNIFELIGRTVWELSGNNTLEDIAYYSRRAKDFATGNLINTAYGNRMFSGSDIVDVLDRSNYGQLLHTLKTDPDSRRAILPIYDPTKDKQDTGGEYPCIMALHFFIRNHKLDLITYARSESAFRILPMDIFMLTLVQEFTAIHLGIEIGVYCHHSGSFHYYIEKDEPAIKNFLGDKELSKSYSMSPLKFLFDNWNYFENTEWSLRTKGEFLSSESEQYFTAHSFSEVSQWVFLLAIYAKFYREQFDKTFYKYIELLRYPYKELAIRWLETTIPYSKLKEKN